MKISHWEKNEADDGGVVLTVTSKEALEIIKSLAYQMLEGRCNGGRVEHYTAEKFYVSIGVVDKVKK